MMRTWDPGRVDAVSRPPACRTPYSTVQPTVCTPRYAQPAAYRLPTYLPILPSYPPPPSTLQSRRRERCHAASPAGPPAQSPASGTLARSSRPSQMGHIRATYGPHTGHIRATQSRVACSSLADHTWMPPLTVGISAVLGRRLPTDRKLASVLQCTRAASAQCCPPSAAHDSSVNGPKEHCAPLIMGRPQPLTTTLAANRLA